MGNSYERDTRINFLLRIPDSVRNEIQSLTVTTRLSEHGQCIALLERSLSTIDQIDSRKIGADVARSKFTLRLPGELHEAIKAASARTGVSMNRIINGCLRAGVALGKGDPDLNAYAETTLASHLPEEVFLDLKCEAQRSEVSLMEMAAQRIQRSYAAFA